MLRTVFILLILIPGFVAALRNRYAALLMYLWFALFRPQDWLWIDITSLRLSMVLGIVQQTLGTLRFHAGECFE